MYTFDTNVIIYYTQEEASVVLFLEHLIAENAPIYVSAITEVELFRFAHLSGAEAERISAFLSAVAIIPLDSQIARIAGALGRNYRLKVADSVIAATTMFTGTTLVTRNIRDFKRISNLRLHAV